MRQLAVDRTWAAVLLLSLLYGVTLGWFSLAAHRALLTQMNDLGNADQAIWAASRGDLLMTVSNDVDGSVKSRLVVHLNLLYLALAPLYRVATAPEVLLGLGALACALAGLGVHAWARLQLGSSWLAVLFPLAFFAHPLVHEANLFDFKIVTVATAALVWSLVAFRSGHPGAGTVLAALVVLSQEDLAILGLFLGLWLIAVGQRKRGAAIAAGTLLYLTLMLAVVVPSLSDGGGMAKFSGAGNRLDWLGADPAAIAKGVFQRPLDILAHLARPDRLRLPAYLLLSGGIAALAAPRLLLLAIPTTLGAMLTGTPWMTQLTGTYYHLPSVAVILMAAAEASARLRERGRPRIAAGNAGYAAAAAIVFSLLLSPLPHSAVGAWSHFPDRAEELAALRSLGRMIPADASLTVQNNLGPHLAHRREIAAFPRRPDSEAALFHLRCPPGPDHGLSVRTSSRVLFQLTPPTLVRNVGEMLRSPGWRLVAVREGFYLFRREEAPPPPATAVRTFLADAARMRRACEEARAPVRWRRLLVGAYRWSELPAVLRGD